MRPAIKFINETLTGRKLVGAEIGVQSGYHALEILNLDMERLYLIDIWGPYILAGHTYDFSNCLEDVERLHGDNPLVEIIRGESEDIAKGFKPKSLDFIYIDGCHDYEAVRADMHAWFPVVIMGGVMSGHDYHCSWPGVDKAVDEFATEYGYEIEHGGPPFEDWWFVK